MAEGQARGPQSFLPRTMHVIEADDLEILDLRDDDALSTIRLSLAAIASDDWHDCQAVGQAAHFLEFQGVLAPSATTAGFVLAVFEERVRRGQLTVVESKPLPVEVEDS